MHLGTSALLKFFEAHRDAPALVLVTITGTEGSTYRKPGAMMLIAPDNTYQGMISGGCLEGDLLHHAQEVFASGKPRSVTYDMHAGDDLVWSLGIGCDGVIRLLLQRLEAGAGFGLLQAIAVSLAARDAVLLALVTESTEAELPAGTIGLYDFAGRRAGHHGLADVGQALSDSGWPAWRHREWAHPGASVMLVNIQPPPRVLLCGAGPDTVPVARQFSMLEWDCVVADHRPAFARSERFPPGCRVILSRPDRLHEELDPGSVDAAVIMSHHLESDAAYLRQLAGAVQAGTLRYVGVLGPAARRDRLREMASCPGLLLRGPVGLDIGAELPEGIALSIAAEIHAVLNARDGHALTNKGRGD